MNVFSMRQDQFLFPEVRRHLAKVKADNLRRRLLKVDLTITQADARKIVNNVYPMQVETEKLRGVTVSLDWEQWAQKFLGRKPDFSPDKPHRSRPWGYKGQQTHREGYKG